MVQVGIAVTDTHWLSLTSKVGPACNPVGFDDRKEGDFSIGDLHSPTKRGPKLKGGGGLTQALTSPPNAAATHSPPSPSPAATLLPIPHPACTAKKRPRPDSKEEERGQAERGVPVAASAVAVRTGGKRGEETGARMPMVTCNACNAGFDTDEQQRLHYRSEWHRYNLKRKVSSPVNAYPSR
jgi:hypothetical protein